MLRWRLILGAIFIAGLFALIWLDARGIGDSYYPGAVLMPLVAVIAIGATQEYVSMAKSREPQLGGWPIYLGNLAILASAALPQRNDNAGWQLAAFGSSLLLVLLIEIFRYDKDASQRVTERIALTVFGLVYIGFLLSFLIRLRLHGQGSIVPLVSMLVVVKMADIGAYTVGRLWGRHKMAPKLSPGKTWEGLAGGLLFSALAGLSFYRYITPIGPLVVYALVVGGVGVLGDLFESLLKRDYGRKDSSTWMPGFGGVLDLIDSPLLAAPVAWAFWHWGWLAG